MTIAPTAVHRVRAATRTTHEAPGATATSCSPPHSSSSASRS